MKCPRCETLVLDERVREGVTIDACRQCRGLWLDRGELEKLIARERRDYEDDHEDYRKAAAAARPPSGYHQPQYKRRKSWAETLGNIFD